MNPIFNKNNKLGKYVLNLCNVTRLNLNLDIITKYISQNINSKIDYYRDQQQLLKMNDYQFIEWVVSKSSGGDIIGNKCKTMNIIGQNNIAIDTSCLSLPQKKGTQTGEKSIVQITDIEDQKRLDKQFEVRDVDLILSIYKIRLIDKYKEFCYQYGININNLYYCIFISDYNNIYMLSLNLDLKYLDYVYGDIISNNKKSIIIHNMIDPKLGSVKIVSKKKRMELRLNQNIIHNSKVVNIL